MILTTDGIDLHYDAVGEGEPLLWLHGFFGIGADWQHIFKTPPAGYRVIAPDLRGHGSSSGAVERFAFRDCARDVVALLHHLRVPRVKAIGLSGGGIALMHLAVMEPALVDAMVVVSAPPYFPEQARALQRQVSDAGISEAEREAMRARHRGGDAQIAALYAHARGFADDYTDARFTPEMLAGIAADTLIVFGDRDPLYPVALATELFAAVPRSYLWVVPNGGHGPVFGEHAGRFAETALEFFAKGSGRFTT
jgi:pimeloyl-ACP methyl ester carboxylesterase